MRELMFAFMALLVMASHASANGACDRINLLVGEQVDSATPIPTVTSMPINVLPKGLRDIVGTAEWSTNGKDAPDEIEGFTMDLNNDGSSEYFLVNEAWSGAHNWSYQVFTLKDGSWKVIGEIFGDIAAVLATGASFGNASWREYVSVARIEYGKSSSAVYAFNGTSYVNVRGKHCDEGVVTDYRK